MIKQFIVKNELDQTIERSNTINKQLLENDNIEYQDTVIVGGSSPEDTMRKMSIQFSNQSSKPGSQGNSRRSSDRMIKMQNTGGKGGKVSSFGKKQSSFAQKMNSEDANNEEGSQDGEHSNDEDFNPYGLKPKSHADRFKNIAAKAAEEYPSRRGSIDDNNLDIVHGLTIQDEDEEIEDPCMICYANPCDSVVLPCGHGNACSSCNHKFISETGKCFVCRADVTQMLRVDVENLRNDCMKVLGATFYVKNEQEKNEKDSASLNNNASQ
jgi:hypothetical protein